MRVRLKGIVSKRKRLADGSLKISDYAWKVGPPLRGEPGSPEFVASYNAAIAPKVTPPTGVSLALLFRFQESAEFQLEYRRAPAATISSSLSASNGTLAIFQSGR